MFKRKNNSYNPIQDDTSVKSESERNRSTSVTKKDKKSKKKQRNRKISDGSSVRSIFTSSSKKPISNANSNSSINDSIHNKSIFSDRSSRSNRGRKFFPDRQHNPANDHSSENNIDKTNFITKLIPRIKSISSETIAELIKPENDFSETVIFVLNILGSELADDFCFHLLGEKYSKKHIIPEKKLADGIPYIFYFIDDNFQGVYKISIIRPKDDHEISKNNQKAASATKDQDKKIRSFVACAMKDKIQVMKKFCIYKENTLTFLYIQKSQTRQKYDQSQWFEIGKENPNIVRAIANLLKLESKPSKNHDALFSEDSEIQDLVLNFAHRINTEFTKKTSSENENNNFRYINESTENKAHYVEPSDITKCITSSKKEENFKPSIRRSKHVNKISKTVYENKQTTYGNENKQTTYGNENKTTEYGTSESINKDNVYQVVNEEIEKTKLYVKLNDNPECSKNLIEKEVHNTQFVKSGEQTNQSTHAVNLKVSSCEYEKTNEYEEIDVYGSVIDDETDSTQLSNYATNIKSSQEGGKKDDNYISSNQKSNGFQKIEQEENEIVRENIFNSNTVTNFDTTQGNLGLNIEQDYMDHHNIEESKYIDMNGYETSFTEKRNKSSIKSESSSDSLSKIEKSNDDDHENQEKTTGDEMIKTIKTIKTFRSSLSSLNSSGKGDETKNKNPQDIIIRNYEKYHESSNHDEQKEIGTHEKLTLISTLLNSELAPNTFEIKKIQNNEEKFNIEIKTGSNNHYLLLYKEYDGDVDLFRLTKNSSNRYTLYTYIKEIDKSIYLYDKNKIKINYRTKKYVDNDKDVIDATKILFNWMNLRKNMLKNTTKIDPFRNFVNFAMQEEQKKTPLSDIHRDVGKVDEKSKIIPPRIQQSFSKEAVEQKTSTFESTSELISHASVSEIDFRSHSPQIFTSVESKPTIIQSPIQIQKKPITTDISGVNEDTIHRTNRKNIQTSELQINQIDKHTESRVKLPKKLYCSEEPKKNHEFEQTPILRKNKQKKHEDESDSSKEPEPIIENIKLIPEKDFRINQTSQQEKTNSEPNRNIAMTTTHRSDLSSLTQLGSTVQNKRSSVKNKGSSVQNKGSTIQNKGSTIQNKGSTVQNKGSTIQNKGSTVQNKETTIQNKETTVQNKETTIQNKETTIQNKETTQSSSKYSSYRKLLIARIVANLVILAAFVLIKIIANLTKKAPLLLLIESKTAIAITVALVITNIAISIANIWTLKKNSPDESYISDNTNEEKLITNESIETQKDKTKKQNSIRISIHCVGITVSFVSLLINPNIVIPIITIIFKNFEPTIIKPFVGIFITVTFCLLNILTSALDLIVINHKENKEDNQDEYVNAYRTPETAMEKNVSEKVDPKEEIFI